MIDSDGFLFITGRIKEILITAGGENVPPVPIEDDIKQELPCVSNAIVVGKNFSIIRWDNKIYLSSASKFEIEMKHFYHYFIIGDRQRFLSCLLTLKTEVDQESASPTNKLSSTTLSWLLEVADVKDAKTIGNISWYILFLLHIGLFLYTFR